MRVVVPPVLIDGRICRIVSPVTALLEVEEWVGEWWQPSTVPLTRASVADAAPLDLLVARGVPDADRVAPQDRPSREEIEAMIRTSDPDRPVEARFDEDVPRMAPVARRDYPGSARFGRPPGGKRGRGV